MKLNQKMKSHLYSLGLEYICIRYDWVPLYWTENLQNRTGLNNKVFLLLTKEFWKSTVQNWYGGSIIIRSRLSSSIIPSTAHHGPEWLPRLQQSHLCCRPTSEKVEGPKWCLPLPVQGTPWEVTHKNVCSHLIGLNLVTCLYLASKELGNISLTWAATCPG